MGGLAPRLTWIDVTPRGDAYPFLAREDRCLFLGDFHGRKGWGGGPTNQLIANFKRSRADIEGKSTTRRLRRYKERAVDEISNALRREFTREEVESLCTFVPIPTSKRPDDPLYCDRLERTLRRAFTGYRSDIRLLLRQTLSTAADHRRGEDRVRYERLLEITELDPRQLVPALRPVVILFDDVLTTGKHYKVAKAKIREVFPEQPIVALFVARCLHA
jgi:hypothetical protein